MPTLLKINDLEKIFAPYRDRLNYYNFWLRADNDLAKAEEEGEIIPATKLLDPVYIREMLEEWDVTLGSKNLKVAAALWTKYYCLVAFPVVMGAMSLGGIGWDATLAKTRIVMSRTAGTKPMDGKGCPVRIIFDDCTRAVVYSPRCSVPELADADCTTVVDTLEELHQKVCQAFFVEHFQPLFEAFQTATGVSPKVLWGNLGWGIQAFAKFMDETLSTPAALHVDGAFMLETPENEWIAEGKNPLYQPSRKRPLEFVGKPGPDLIRTSCCLWYKVPGAEKCGTCPLCWPVKRAERLELQTA